MSSGNITKNISYITALNKFVNDVKPYHSKLTEIQENVYFTDAMSVKITDDIFKMGIRLRSVHSQTILGYSVKTIYAMTAQLSRGRSEYGVASRIYTVTTSTPYAATDIVGLSTRHSSYLAPNTDGILSVSVNQKIQQLGYSVFKSHGVISIDIDANGGNPQWRETLSPEAYWKLPDPKIVEILPTATSQTWSLIKIDPIVTDKILFNGVGLDQSTATSIDSQPNITIDPYSLVGATVQTWTITAISTSSFSVVGSVSGAQTNATLGQLYEGQFKFTIPATGYTFSPGDAFSFKVLSRQPSYLVYGSQTGMLAPATVGVQYDTTYEPATPISFKLPLPIYIGPNGQTGTIFTVGNFDLTFLSAPRFDAEDENFVIRAIDSTTCDVFSSQRGHLPAAIIGQAYDDPYAKFMVTGMPNRGDEVRFSVSTRTRLPQRFGHDVFIFGQSQFSSGKVTGVSSILHTATSRVLLKQYSNDTLYFKMELPTSATTFTASSVLPIALQGSPSPGRETQTTIKLLNPVAGQTTVGTLTLATSVLSLTNNFINTFLPSNKPCTIEIEQQGNYLDRLSVKIVDQLIFRLDLPKANRLMFDDFLLATRNLGYDTLPYDVSTPPFSLIYPPDDLQNGGFQIIGITTSTYSPSHAVIVTGNQTAAFSSLTNSVVIIADIPRSGLYGVTNVIFNGVNTAVLVDRPLTDANGNTDVIGKRIYTDRSLAVSRYDRHLEIILPDPDLPLDNADDISTAQVSEASIIYDLNHSGTGGFDSGAFDSSAYDSTIILGEIVVSLPTGFLFADSAEYDLAQNTFFKNKRGSYAIIDPNSAGLSNVLLTGAKINYLGEPLTTMPKLYLLTSFSDPAPQELSIVNRYPSSIWRSFSTTFPFLLENRILILVV